MNLTALRNELQARINALTNASIVDDVISVAIATKKAATVGVYVDRTNLTVQFQRVTNGIGAANAIDDLIAIAASIDSNTESIPLGTVQKFAFAGDKFTDSNNHEWLYFGLLHSKAGYERALENPGLRAYGRQVYTAQANTAGRVTKAAEDGLGNIVIACESATHVIVSNNNGETFNAVVHNLPGKAVTVEYVGGHFIVAGNDAERIFTSYSENGGQSFSNSTNARAFADGVADTVRSACSGVVALFVTNNTRSAVSKSNGLNNTAVTLPAAVNGSSYTPLVQFFNNAFYVAGKNIQTYYKTINNGVEFTSHNKPIGPLIQEQTCVALGKFFWMGQSGSTRIYRYTSDFVTWKNLMDILPVGLVQAISESSYISTAITLAKVKDGLLICTSIGNYFTADLENYSLIHFSRSARELAGATTEYYCFGNIVAGGIVLTDAGTGQSSSSLLKVNYAEPDYVGVHRNSVASITDHQVEYVRIR